MHFCHLMLSGGLSVFLLMSGQADATKHHFNEPAAIPPSSLYATSFNAYSLSLLGTKQAKEPSGTLVLSDAGNTPNIRFKAVFRA